MSKAWKGLLKDDASFSALGAALEGATIMLSGTAAAVVKPVDKPVFMEDLPPSEIMKAGAMLPAGLTNLANTCYMNATLQCIRAVPELASSVTQYGAAWKKEYMARAVEAAAQAAPGGGAGGAAAEAVNPVAAVDAALGDVFAQLEVNSDAVKPAGFLRALRVAYPKFAEVGANQVPKQQDAEEFEAVLMNSLATELTKPTEAVPALQALPSSEAPPNVVDTLFGVELEVEMTCAETDAEPPVVRREVHRKLVCNIDGGAGKSTQVNHLLEGIVHGLGGEVEKRSDVLDRNAMWKRTARIAHLPRYFMVQMMRFFWKATPDSRDHQGVPCKILRPVAFPADNFDVYSICSRSVQEALKVGRDKYERTLLPAPSAKSPTGAAAASAAATAASAAAPAPAAATAAAEGGAEMAELEAALRMSMGGAGGGAGSGAASAAASGGDAFGPGIPADFRGLYELFAVVTHKGRDSSSGHYMGWVRSKAHPDDWLVFDDDEVRVGYDCPAPSPLICRLLGAGVADARPDRLSHIAFAAPSWPIDICRSARLAQSL